MANFAITPTETSFNIQVGENTLAAANSATAAAASAAAAAASEAAAESLVGPVYADTAAGLAATTNGDFFAVNNSGTVTIYLNSSGAAVAQRTLATSAALAASGGAALVGYTQGETGASNRTVQAKLRDTISVKDFGAVGDGTTDDTAAINNALALGVGVYFPPGTYLIDAILTPADKTRMFGAGQSSVIKLADSSDVTMVDVGGHSDIVIEYLAFDGNAANQTSTADISCVSGTNVTRFAFRNNYVKDIVGRGVNVRHSSSDFTCTQNTFENVGSNTSDLGGVINFTGTGGTDSKRATITSNIINVTSQKGINCRAADVIVAANNTFIDTGRECLYFRDGKDLRVIGNYGVVNGVSTADIGLTLNDIKFATVVGNIFDNGNLGVEITNGSEDITVNGNAIRNVAAPGIVVDRCNRVAVTGNSVLDCGNPSSTAESGIRIITSSSVTSEDITVNGNTIRVLATDAYRGITIFNNGGTLRRIAIVGNSVNGNGGTTSRGISVDDTGSGDTVEQVSVVGNTVSGFTIRGLFSRAEGDVTFSGNVALVRDITMNAGVTINGLGVESANAETPTAANWQPGNIVSFTDTGDGTGTGTYLLGANGSTWTAIA